MQAASGQGAGASRTSARAAGRAAAHRIRHVLVYGTLCAREPVHERFGLRESLTFVGHRRVPGTVYDLGPYPGLVLGPGTAPAELYRIDDPAVMACLDRYEGYDPRAAHTSLFVRTAVRVPRHARAAAGTLDAWVYTYNGAVTGRPAIHGRTWREHRRRREAAVQPFDDARTQRG